MAGREGISATALSREVGVAQATLSRWLRDARNLEPMSLPTNGSEKPTAQRPQDWSAQEKLDAVHEATRLPEKELGTFLRKKGLHAADLEAWRAAVLAALGGKPKGRSRKGTPESKKIRVLEKELNRKDRALAEVTALLALQKKLERIWGAGATARVRGEGHDSGPHR